MILHRSRVTRTDYSRRTTSLPFHQEAAACNVSFLEMCGPSLLFYEFTADDDLEIVILHAANKIRIAGKQRGRSPSDKLPSSFPSPLRSLIPPNMDSSLLGSCKKLSAILPSLFPLPPGSSVTRDANYDRLIISVPAPIFAPWINRA